MTILYTTCPLPPPPGCEVSPFGTTGGEMIVRPGMTAIVRVCGLAPGAVLPLEVQMQGSDWCAATDLYGNQYELSEMSPTLAINLPGDYRIDPDALTNAAVDGTCLYVSYELTSDFEPMPPPPCNLPTYTYTHLIDDQNRRVFLKQECTKAGEVVETYGVFSGPTGSFIPSTSYDPAPLSDVTTTTEATVTLANGAVEDVLIDTRFVDGVAQPVVIRDLSGAVISPTGVRAFDGVSRPLQTLAFSGTGTSGSSITAGVTPVTNSQGVQFPSYAYVHVQQDAQTATSAAGIAYTVTGAAPTAANENELAAGQGTWLSGWDTISGFRYVPLGSDGDIDGTKTAHITVTLFNIAPAR